MVKTVGIVGYGRFGKLWQEMLTSDFDVAIWDLNPSTCALARSANVNVEDLSTLCKRDVIFFAVPISSFEQSLASAAPHFGPRTAVIDLLSVKVHPKSVVERALPLNTPVMLTHPMFGPDSVRLQGIAGQQLVVDSYRMNAKDSEFWRSYFRGRGLHVHEMSAEDHDRLAAKSQGVAHFIGRILGETGFEPTAIDTLGAKRLFEVKDQVCNDTWQLFVDLQTYNPFTVEMRSSLGKAQARIYNKLLPNRIHKDRLLVGIQGGKGSFNEEAARYYLNRAGVSDFELSYLYTTENVLAALHEGRIDRGQFAIHNSLGGMVSESVQAMAQHNFKIIEEYSIKISHTLMTHPAVELFEVDSVMAHPQVFRQCQKNLSQKYPRLKLVSGEGELVDHARVAELLGRGELPRSTATMGSKVLAEIHNLRIVEENLQDLAENFTSFLFVERPE